MRRSAALFLSVSTALVLVALVAGFVIIPTPAQQHVYDLDTKRIGALDLLESAINAYVASHNALPVSLADLNEAVKWSIDGTKDVETGRDYEYVKGQGLSYRLCATFDAPSQKGSTGVSWHPAGHFCQNRTAMRLPKP